MGAAGLLMLIWLQLVEGWSFGPRLVTYGGRLLDREIVFVAWRHERAAWQIGAFLAQVLYNPRYPSSRTLRLRQWADSLGFSYYTWVGPQGMACALEVSSAHRTEAMSWLYAMLSTVEVGDGHWYEWGVYQWGRGHVGLQLAKEALYLLWGWSPHPPTHQAALYYLQTYLRPESLYVGCWGRLSMREKAAWRRQWALWRGFQREAQLALNLPETRGLSKDTLLENSWAYPAYGVLSLRLPSSWPERLAFVAALESRLSVAAPSLAYRAAFVGDRYQIEGRFDWRSYELFRRLDWLAPSSPEELKAWQAAYQLRQAKALAYPIRYLDLWMGALLAADTLSFPETWPDSLWKVGWPIQLQGVWIVPPDWGLDTLIEPTESKVHLVLDSTLQVFRPFEALWQPHFKGDSPPLGEWAAGLQVALKADSARRWLLVGYYRRKKARAATLRYLHSLRRLLISQYQIPPSALEVRLLPLPPDFHPKTIRLVCVGL